MKQRLIPILRMQWLLLWRGFLSRWGDGSRYRLILLPGLVLALISFIGAIVTLYTVIYLAASSLGQGEVVITLGAAVGQITCMVLGIFYIISAFYFSKDIEFLTALPVRPSEIVLSKFLGVLGGEYLTTAWLVLPAFLVYGWNADVSWTYWPFALIIFLLLPVVPLVVSALFSLVLMRVTSFRRNRDFWRVAGACAGAALILVIQRFTRGTVFSVRPETVAQTQQYLQASGGVLQSVGRYLPTSLWATEALRSGAPAGGIGGFLLFVAASAAAVALLSWAAEGLFLGGLEGGAAGKPISRYRTGKAQDLSGSVRSPLAALVLREIRLFNRTPSFLMAGILPTVLLSVLLLLSLTQESAFREMAANLRQAAAHPAVSVAAWAWAAFCSAISSVGATAVSREGRQVWISRSLPVAPHVQIRAKVIHCLLVNSLNVVVILGVLWFMGVTQFPILFRVALGGILMGAVVTYVTMVPDILTPHLNWTDPQQAMNGNMNGLFSMLGLILLMALLAAGGRPLHDERGTDAARPSCHFRSAGGDSGPGGGASGRPAVHGVRVNGKRHGVPVAFLFSTGL